MPPDMRIGRECEEEEPADADLPRPLAESEFQLLHSFPGHVSITRQGLQSTSADTGPWTRIE